MKTALLILILFVCNFSFSQRNRELTPEVIQAWEVHLKNQPQTKMLVNAISNNDLKNLSLNRDQLSNLDFHFKYKVETYGITDQKKSGRCWMFTGLNILRPKIIKKLDLTSFEFSTNYLYFYDLLEKANLALEIAIETASKPLEDKTIEWLLRSPIDDGGVWTSLVNLINKYGVVPKEVMPETYHSENTGQMRSVLSSKTRESVLRIREMHEKKQSVEKIREEKIKMLADIYKILVYHLGFPPKEFEWRYKTKDDKISDTKKYTPMSFLKEMFPEFDTKQYVQLMNDPSRPYYKTYEIEYDRNTVEGVNWVYLNLPVEEIKKFAIQSIKSNEIMYFSCDVAKQLNSEKGFSSIINYEYSNLYGIAFTMNKKERIQTFESGSSHAMALVAVDTDANERPTKWLVENSWGANSGFNGFIVMTDTWFSEYMFRLVVKKDFIDEKTLSLFQQKPIKLPPWDPMFKYDE